MSTEIDFDRAPDRPGEYRIVFRADGCPDWYGELTYRQAQRLNRQLVLIIAEDDAYQAAAEGEYERQQMGSGR